MISGALLPAMYFLSVIESHGMVTGHEVHLVRAHLH